jgi:hypothetical protein
MWTLYIRSALALFGLLGACNVTPAGLSLATPETTQAEALRYVQAGTQAPHYVLADYGNGCRLERDKDGIARVYCSIYVASEERSIERIAPPAPAL